MTTIDPTDNTYLFPFSSTEHQRLETMAHLLAPSTRRLLEQAGVTRGMKVLDVGSGLGDVALLAADLVGPMGSVVGIERNPSSLDVARARAHAAGLTHVSYLEADLTQLQHLQFEPAFDAVIGRLILQHLPDPSTALHRLAGYLRPGGILAFQEIALPETGASFPPVALLEQMYQWARMGLRCAGVESQFGLHLHWIFLNAGLPAPELHCDTFIGAGAAWDWYEVIAETIRSLLPVIVTQGIATEEEIEIDTLAQRCREAAVSQQSVVFAPHYISAWIRTMSSNSPST